ncbi:MAG: hypothetical protein GY834_09795 [Bacteroidetes bacterium]|nr:hypothetical protein [Bacteroidota bacterium]
MPKTCILLTLLTFPLILIAQQNDSISIADSTSIDSEVIEDIDFLMLSLNYTNNNTLYKNLDQQLEMHTFSSDISFFSKSGLWAAISITDYFKANKTTYETELQLGYQKAFLNFSDLDISYAFHDFKGDPEYEGISYKHSVTGSVSLNSKYVSFFSDIYFMTGLTDNFFIDLSASVNIEFEGLFNKNDFIMITPTISTSLGTDDWIYERFTIQQRHGRTQYLERNGYSTGQFEYQSLGVYLPVIYNINTISLSFTVFYNSPSSKLKAINWEDQSGILISIFFTPNL